MLNLDAVEYVEEDGVYRASVTWGLDRVDQRDLPLDNTYNPSGECTLPVVQLPGGGHVPSPLVQSGLVSVCYYM